jgi:hypothetical protein
MTLFIGISYWLKKGERNVGRKWFLEMDHQYKRSQPAE